MIVTDKIEQFWRDANAEDAASGKNLVARFRDNPNGGWSDNRTLSGFRRVIGEPSFLFYDGTGVSWTQCQVYEPQQWWLDKPDPGEGWRLLEKFPPEELQPGDEWFEPDPLEAGWKVSHNERQANTLWYRRRIEPNKPEKLYSSPCASTIPKGWTALLLDEPRLASDAYWSQDAEAWVIISDGWVDAANREKWPAIRLSAECAQPEPQTNTSETPNSSAATQPTNLPALKLGDAVMLPNGQAIRITKSGFEVF